MEEITSANNPKIKKAVRLHDSRGRKQQNRIIIFGLAENKRYAESGRQFDELYCCTELCSPAAISQFESSDAKSKLSVTPAIFEKLTFGSRVEGLIGVASRPSTSIENWSQDKFEFVVVLEAIEKPGNVGAVFRSCVAAGADAFVLANPKTDVYHPNSIRSSLGSVFSVPVFCAESTEVQGVLSREKMTVAAALVDAEHDFRQLDLTRKSAIVLGNEAIGLSSLWSQPPNIPVTIPMPGNIDSLNIAMSATVLAYEVQRQRQINSQID